MNGFFSPVSWNNWTVEVRGEWLSAANCFIRESSWMKCHIDAWMQEELDRLQARKDIYDTGHKTMLALDLFDQAPDKGTVVYKYARAKYDEQPPAEGGCLAWKSWDHWDHWKCYFVFEDHFTDVHIETTRPLNPYYIAFGSDGHFYYVDYEGSFHVVPLSSLIKSKTPDFDL